MIILRFRMKKDWEKKATNILRAEIVKRGLSYEELQQKLAGVGIEETAHNLSLKICRGSFKFSFFLQVMQAIGAKTLRIEEDE